MVPAMLKKPKKATGRARKEWPGDIGQPIVVPFRGMPDGNNFPLDGLQERFQKLIRLADHYGINRGGDPGWGLLLAYQIASDLHPGFELVYNDWQATAFKSLYGLTPLHRLREGARPGHRPKGSGWAALFAPEVVALWVDTLSKIAKKKGKKISEKKICELIAISVDPDLEKRANQSEKEKRVATLIRRLSEGRKRKST